MNKELNENLAKISETLGLPKVSVNKNGYEIRTKILEMAMSNVWQDYYARWGQFEVSGTKIGTDETVHKITFPTVPGTEEILKSAEQMYGFVCEKNATHK